MKQASPAAQPTGAARRPSIEPSTGSGPALPRGEHTAADTALSPGASAQARTTGRFHSVIAGAAGGFPAGGPGAIDRKYV